jgi:hypothetical protein
MMGESDRFRTNFFLVERSVEEASGSGVDSDVVSSFIQVVLKRLFSTFVEY